MKRLLVVILNDASKAFDGREVLKSLGRDESIIVHAHAIITKKTDGTIIVNENEEPGPLGTVLGASLGSLIGLLGGPTGVAIGAIAGSVAGGIADRDKARIDADFVDEVSRQLTPGKFALVAEIDEDWTPWINLPMEELGGVVYRWPLSDAEHAANAEDIAAMKANVAQSRAGHKAKLLDKINQLDTKIQQQLQKAKEGHEIAEAKAQAKANVLEANAARTREKLNTQEK